jgi:hypothetical protein
MKMGITSVLSFRMKPVSKNVDVSDALPKQLPRF